MPTSLEILEDIPLTWFLKQRFSSNWIPKNYVESVWDIISFSILMGRSKVIFFPVRIENILSLRGMDYSFDSKQPLDINQYDWISSIKYFYLIYFYFLLFLILFVTTIKPIYNQLNAFRGKLASLNVVTPLTTLSMLVVRVELPFLSCLSFVCPSLQPLHHWAATIQ